ncbi:hypothetical protein IAT40_007782 [Kwoniella sp. CBS 6097]
MADTRSDWVYKMTPPASSSSPIARKRGDRKPRRRRQSTVRSDSGGEQSPDDTGSENDGRAGPYSDNGRGRIRANKRKLTNKRSKAKAEQSDAESESQDYGKRSVDSAGGSEEEDDKRIGNDSSSGSGSESERSVTDRRRERGLSAKKRGGEARDRGPPDRGRSPIRERSGPSHPSANSKNSRPSSKSTKPGARPPDEKKTEEKRKFDKEGYNQRSLEVNSSWNKRPSAWSGCCVDLSKCWGGLWSWYGWRTIVRNVPYLLALQMGVGGVFVGSTGDMIGIWTFNMHGGGSYGGLGYCKSGNSGCKMELFYDGPAVGSWHAKSLSALLLSYAVAEWVSEGGGGVEGDWGWDAAVFLGASPLAWLLCRMTYRSRWAYLSSSLRKSKESIKNKWDETKYGPPAIDDRDKSITSYKMKEGSDGKPKRIRRPQGKVVDDDEDY